MPDNGLEHNIDLAVMVQPERRLRVGEHFSLNAFWFASNLLWGAILMIIIPSQMKKISPTHPAEMTGLLLGVGAIPAIIIPLLVGPLSDRCSALYGRRRPWMIIGVAINLLGLVLLWLSSVEHSLPLCFAGYFAVNIGNNTASTAYCAVIPDIVPGNQRGVSSGWMASLSQLGTMAGVLASGLLLNRQMAGTAYLLIGTTLALFLLITLIGTKERPIRATGDRIQWRSLIHSVWIDPRDYPNFALVWLNRLLVGMGFWTIQEFMQFYLTDVIHVQEEHKEILTGYILFTSLLCATISAIVAGVLSDRVGRKRVVLYSNLSIAAICACFLLAHNILTVYILAVLFGLGFGAYTSADWALGCDVLPRPANAAGDMAVWHISMTLPQVIALPISGIILSLFGKYYSISATGGQLLHYTSSGFIAIFILAATYLLVGAILIQKVRGVR